MTDQVAAAARTKNAILFRLMAWTGLAITLLGSACSASAQFDARLWFAALIDAFTPAFVAGLLFRRLGLVGLVTGYIFVAVLIIVAQRLMETVMYPGALESSVGRLAGLSMALGYWGARFTSQPRERHSRLSRSN